MLNLRRKLSTKLRFGSAAREGPLLSRFSRGTDHKPPMIASSRLGPCLSVSLNPRARGQWWRRWLAWSAWALVAMPVLSGLRIHAATVTVGANPELIAINPVTNKIYILGNAVTVIDGATLATTSVPVSGDAIAINSTTNKIYVVSGSGTSKGGVLSIIDGGTNATTAVPLGVFNSAAIAINAVTNKIYVANANTAGSVSVIDGSTNAITTLAVGNQPYAIAVNSVTNKIYLTQAGARDAAVIDGATNAITTVPVASGAEALAINSVTNQIYIASSPLTVIDGATNATTTIAVGQVPTAIAINSATNTIYVSAIVAGASALTDNGTVSVINGATNAVTTISTGIYPNALAVNATTNTIYVANEFGNNVTVITGSSVATTTMPAGANPFGIAVDSATNQIYVTNNGDSTVGVFAGPTTIAPTITSAPTGAAITSGTTVVFNVTATGSPAPSYQWNLSGVALNGATGSRLVVNGATAANAGAYTCTVTNASGSVTSGAANLSLVSSANPGRLINISVLSNFSAGQVLTVGFVTGGAGTSGNQALLIRADGPTLASFNVGGTMADPKLSLIPQGGSVVASNDNWGSPTTNQQLVINADTSTGAFALVPGSLDAALVTSLSPGPYTVQVSGSGPGTALTEVFDATAAGSYGLSSSRLINISCNTTLPVAGSLTAGFTVGGSTSKTVLIRASGPTLAGLGVTGTVVDPQIVVQASGAPTSLTQNAGWGGDPQIAKAAASVGAFAFASPTSADSAVLITLPPGGYTAIASSASGGGGTTVLEVYEVP